jgi:heme-degrading monooxygenase HmoA
MFMASEQLKVFSGHEAAIEKLWALKQSSFQSAPGFISYRFTKGRATESGVVYMSLTVWVNEESFLAWRCAWAGQREWSAAEGPERSRLEEFDAMIPRTNPQ